MFSLIYLVKKIKIKMHEVNLSHTTRATQLEFPALRVTHSLSVAHTRPHTMPFSPNTDTTEHSISMDADTDSSSYPPGSN